MFKQITWNWITHSSPPTNVMCFRVFEYLEIANFFSPCTVWSRDFFTVGLVEPMSDHNDGGKNKTSLKPIVLLKIQK